MPATTAAKWARYDEDGECLEADCRATRRRLQRPSGDTYPSDWCAEHSCLCVVCHVPIDDGEDFCPTHQRALSARYEVDLSTEVCHTLHAGTHPLQRLPAESPS